MAFSSFGDTIRELRRSRGWNQARLGDLLGLTQPDISRLEANRTEPTATELAIILTSPEIAVTEAERRALLDSAREWTRAGATPSEAA